MLFVGQFLSSLLYNQIIQIMPKKGKPSRKRLADFNGYNLCTDEVEEARGPSLRSFKLRRAEALQFLSGTNMPSKFRFRQREIERIKAFLSECLQGRKKGYRFLMVTGSPGAGKTLCLNSVLAGCECEVLRLNANVVRSVGEVQALITTRLLGDDHPRTAPQIIRQLQQSKWKGSLVVYVQQIEQLFKSAPDVVSQDFLALFLRKSINLVMVGVSNTIDTLQKYSGKYSFKVSDIENVVFAPYRAEHIAGLLGEKLAQVGERFDLNVEFPQKLLRFASQKLQSLRKGDFRICMQFLKETVRSCLSGEGEEGPWAVDIGVLNAVFDKMQISKNDLMSKLPYQQAILLIAMHNVIVRTDALCVSLKELQPELKWICGSLQIGCTVQLVDERLRDLEQYGVIVLRRKVTGVMTEVQVMLQVSTEDIRGTFAENELLGKFLVEGK